MSIPKLFSTTDDFIAAMKLFQKNGVQTGLHLFLNRVSSTSSFFQPSNPGNGLHKMKIGTLKQSISAAETRIELKALENYAEYKQYLKLGLLNARTQTLLIDNEIIKTSGVEGSVLSASQRGLYKTIPQAHSERAEVYVIWDLGGTFILEPGSALAAASAQSFASFANKADINFIYSDGWTVVTPVEMDNGRTSISFRDHYGVRPYLSLLKSPVAIQSGSGVQAGYALNYSIKTASWDGVVFKNKIFTRYFKTMEMEHLGTNPYGDTKIEMGWWKINGAQFGKGMYDFDSVTFDDVHYAMTKAFAYKTSMGMQTEEFSGSACRDSVPV